MQDASNIRHIEKQDYRFLGPSQGVPTSPSLKQKAGISVQGGCFKSQELLGRTNKSQELHTRQNENKQMSKFSFLCGQMALS